MMGSGPDSVRSWNCRYGTRWGGPSILAFRTSIRVSPMPAPPSASASRVRSRVSLDACPNPLVQAANLARPSKSDWFRSCLRKHRAMIRFRAVARVCFNAVRTLAWDEQHLRGTTPTALLRGEAVAQTTRGSGASFVMGRSMSTEGCHPTGTREPVDEHDRSPVLRARDVDVNRNAAHYRHTAQRSPIQPGARLRRTTTRQR
jgi:hypothetical protein